MDALVVFETSVIKKFVILIRRVSSSGFIVIVKRIDRLLQQT
jgi:hypothetical protein